jgi:hypothetical protein
LIKPLLLLLLPLLADCTVNPATDGRNFTAFMSQEDELRVGQQLARHSKLPKMAFRFTVLNDDQHRPQFAWLDRRGARPASAESSL